jgi:hypothetical protein
MKKMSRHSRASGPAGSGDAPVALDALEQARADLLLAALALPALDSELADEDASVAAITARIRASTPRRSVPRPAGARRPIFRSRRPMLRSLALACCLLAAMSGAAFAGVLPGAAQQVARQMLGRIGVHVPGPSGHAVDHPNTRGTTPAQPAASDQGSKPGRSTRAGGTTGVGHPGRPSDPGKGNGHPQPAPKGPGHAGRTHPTPAPVAPGHVGGSHPTPTPTGPTHAGGSHPPPPPSGGSSKAGSPHGKSHAH